MYNHKSRLGQFLDLSWADKMTLFAAIFMLPVAWGALRLFGLSRLQDYLTRPGQVRAAESSMDELKRRGRLVNAAARYSPWHVTCLTRSLYLTWLLRRRGVMVDLRIGVRHVAGELDAHAWVEFEGEPINDSSDIGDKFAAFTGLPMPEADSFS